MKIVIQESDKDGQWYPKFVGGNGEDWFWAEGYTSQNDAERSVLNFIEAVRKSSQPGSFDAILLETYSAEGFQLEAPE